jgi:lysophospholipase L1-like esterase
LVPVSFADPVVTGGAAPVQVSCTRSTGSIFNAGQSTTVQCTAVDANGRSASCVFNVVVNALPPVLTYTKFTAFGDSMTAGEVTVPVGSSTRSPGQNFALIVVPAASYPTRLENFLRNRYITQAASIQVTNAGLPAEGAQDGASRLSKILATSVPQVLILLEGINDVGGQLDAGITRAANAITSMTRDAKSRGFRVMIATEPPTRAGIRSVPTQLVTTYNDRLRAIAAAEGVVLVDLYSGMVGDVARYIGVDGLHPTEAGYERMAELVYLSVRQNFEER